jgi:hypothetical protein
MKVAPGVWRVEHTVVIVCAVLIAAIVFLYSGDTDPLFAIGSGVGAGMLAYLITFFRSRW